MKDNPTPPARRPVALVTGGSRGIGRGIAEHLARSGFDIAINGMREPEAVAEVVFELEKLGAGVHYCQGDISDLESRHRIMWQVRERFGHLNVLVNNAGMAPKERK